MIKFCFTVLFSVIFLTQANASIIECQRLYEILPLIEEDTLVVFNINNVLTISSQDAGSTPWADEQINKLIEEKNLSKPHATNLFIPVWHDILVVTDVELFDPDAEYIVNYLQKNGVKTIALTNRYTEMAYSTHRNLRSVGIDFAKNTPYPEDCWVDGITSPSKYIEGILFNGLINFKGDTLVAFLKQINYTPKKLIYIEDKLKHLSQVEKCVSSLGIPFLGIHFGALELQRESYNPALAALQVKFHSDILDDASAKKICYCDCEILNIRKEQIQQLPENMHRIHSIQEIDCQLDENTLFITELDQVLWNTQGSIGSRLFFQYYRDKQQFIGFSSELARKNTERLMEKVYRRAQVKLIENESLLFFDKLHSKNCWSVGISYRPNRLHARTILQAKELGLSFNSPFIPENNLQDSRIICSEVPNGQIKMLEKKMSDLSVLPSKLIGLSSFFDDLVNLQKIANKFGIPFQGYLLETQQKIILDDRILGLELECLDRLLTNTEAKILTED
jgi:hypothetical protein